VTKKSNTKPEPQSRTVDPKRVAVALMIVVLIVAFLWKWCDFIDSENQALIAPVSKLNFTGIEPQVTTKIKTLLEKVKKDPDTATSWGELAMNLDAHDFRSESIPIYKKAAKSDPADFRWPYFCAIALSEMGNAEALEWFESAKKMNPTSAPMLVKYGDALVQFQKKDEAIQKYEQALQHDPQNAHALYGLARVAFAKEDLDTTRKNLQRVLEVNPNFGEAYSLMVSVCRQQKDLECVSKNSKIAARFTEKTGMADPVYSELVTEGVSSIWYSFRGTQYFRNGDYDSAINEFKKALELRPNAQSYEDLGNVLNAAGRYSEAAAHYRSALKTHPSADNYFNLGVVLARTAKYSEAIESFQQAIAKKPDFAEAYFNLAVVYAKGHRLQDVIENLQQAIRINPEYSEAHFYLGQTYVATKNRDAAIQELEILRKLNPEMAKQLQAHIKSL
jgi:tetratricopeptide (TPR) repeat protein